MTTNNTLTAAQVARYHHLRRAGHGALRAFHAARSTIGQSMRARTMIAVVR